MIRALDLVAPAILVLTGVATSLYFLAAQGRENRRLRDVARSLWEGGRVRGLEDLVALQTHLRTHISPWDVEPSSNLLRRTALETLETGRGLCGDNARAAILLLRTGGCPARRVYLHGPRWGHVVVEHRWEGGWTIFDAHADPPTILPPERLGAVATRSFRSLPNGYPENPWIAYSRVRHLRSVPGLRRFAGSPLPGPIVVLAESPNLVRALASLLLPVAGVAWWLWT